ncbi:MAG: MBOAT family protein, partial [Oscillospiraceae bacterium]|nr:MBOAT family protein [Oscillospiraceae bacterium]
GIEVNMPVFDLLLPVGISFYTFQALGYAIDVYLGNVKREKSFVTYALFVSFFPQLVAGPIERSKNLLPQFRENHKFEYNRVREGLVLMAWGFFKKMVIADGVATFVTLVYTTPTNYTGLQMIIATVLFSFQVYCDFAGYSDIAIGCAKVLGFKLMRNFNKPYFSTSFSQFWSRWHISLSTWFQDYIFMPFVWTNPLRRFGFTNPPVIAGVWIVFLVSGLWHGSAWTFVIWGVLHAVFRTIEELMRRYYKKPDKHPKPLKYWGKVLWVFAWVTFSYIFFRANTIADATYIATHLFSDIGQWFTGGYFVSQLEGLTFFTNKGIALVGSIVFMLAAELWEGKGELSQKICKQKAPIRWIFYYAVILLILFYGNFGKSPFVYFDF